jgi:hypothetical protein
MTRKPKRPRRVRLTWRRCRLRKTRSLVKVTAVANLRRWHAVEGPFAVAHVASLYGQRPKPWLAIRRLARGEHVIKAHSSPRAARDTCEKVAGGVPVSRGGRRTKVQIHNEQKAAAAVAAELTITTGPLLSPAKESDMSASATKTRKKKAAKPKAIAERNRRKARIKDAARAQRVHGTTDDKATSLLAEKDGKLSLIDAAAKVLASAKEPMNTKALVEAIVARKLWSPGEGKTPAATLAAAIITEMKKKGKDARFKRASPGHFELA